MAAEVFALAAERARTMQTQFIATAKASKGMQEALAVRPLTAFSSDAAVSAQRMQILNSMFKQGTTGLINFGKNVQWTGRQLMVGFTIPLTIFGTTAGKVFSDLEKQAVAFKKVYGDIFTTPAELEENFKAVQGLSREFTKYGIAAKDTLGLAAQAAAAGRKNTELTDAVRESTRLATLGQMDQNAALETTISLQSAFRLSGQELADTINFLNMVENQTVVSLQDIAAAIPRVAPVVKGLGGDVKDLTVFLAAMQEGGVSAEQGANALKSGLGSLINPTKAATDVLAGFKINLDSIIQTNRGDLMGTVTAFSQALSTLDEFSRQQALESLFGKFQYARLGALFENISREGSQAQQVISTLGYSTEQLAKSAEKELTTVEQAFSTQLTGAIERLKIAIAPLGEIFVKMAIPIVNMVTKIVDAFNRLPEGVKNVAALATVLGGVLLPAATMIFGLFANLIGTFAKFSHSMGMFGVTLLRKGPLAAIKSLTQSANYLSLSEIDAANAARQLGSATELANAALLSQVGSANSADVAIKNLTNSYRVLISEQTRASQVQPFLFGTGQAASSRVGGSAAASVATTMATRGKSRIKAVGLNQGGSVFTPDNSSTVPGVGNTDKVPAMLTPGEFVVNKESTKNNLGLLHSINAQRLNVGGKVKNGIQYGMSGFLVGNTPGYSAATNAVAAKLVGRSQVAKTMGTKASNKAEQLKNNLVYLLTKSNNQQLTGVRTMKEFDKRGVPLDVLKQDMVSEEGLWMIDAFAKGDWKKDAYKATLENNFANIAAKYPGKEIRFLDSAGLERVQPLLGKPEYKDVQFVSVKELQNKELFDNLTPEHLETLMTDATQVSKELKYSKSRGTTSLKDVYRGIPGMESYARIQKNWRGTPKPKNRQGAHMYNMGGKVEGMQYFGTKEKNRVVKNNRKKVPISQHYAFDTVALSGSDAANFNRQMNVLYNISREMSKVDKSSLPLYMQVDNLPLNANHAKQLLDILIENNISPKKFPAVFSFLQNAVNNPNEYNQRILNGLIASNKESLVEKGITQSEANKQAKFNLFNSLKGQQGVKINTYQEALDALSSLDDHTSTEFLTKRIKQGSIKKVPLGKGYSEAKARVGRYASGKTSIPGKTRLHMTTPMMMMTMLGLNEGGMIPGVQYAMSGKLIKDSMRAPFGVPAWGPNKSSSVAKGSWESLMEGITTRRKYDFDKFPIETLKSGMTAGRRTSGTRPLNVEIYDPITKKTIGQYDVNPNNALEKRSLLNTLQVEKSKGFKEAYIRGIGEGFNKGGMIPGAQYLNIGGRLGKAIFERGIVGKPKIMNLSGLAKNGENVVIDLVNGGMKVDDAIKFAKLTQTGQLRTGIPTGPVRDIEDYIQRQISFEKSQGSMTRSLYKEFYGMRHKSKSEQQKIIDNYNKLYWGDMGTAMYNKGGIAKFNRGSIVPGTGNTDTVPAMLTPGEFVINKESTKQNYDLLTAINSGKVNNYNKGGVASGVQYLQEGAPVKRGPGIAGMVAGTAASMLPFAFTDQLGMMGSMVASMVGFSAASKATTTLVKSYGDEVANGVGRTKALSIAFKTLSKVALAGMGGWVALGTSIISLGVIFTKINNNIKDGGARLSNAMYGSAESLNKMAEAFGRMTPNQKAIQRQADLAAGQATSEEAKQQSSKFMESQSGQQLLKDLALVKKMGEDQVSALKNQLASAVITGIITPEEARQIATDVGIALNDKKLAVSVSGQLSSLLGPNGEKIENNRMQIFANISPTVDPTKIKEETQKQMEVIRSAKLNPFDVGYDFTLALERANVAVSELFGQNVENARAANTLQENILENVKKEAEVRALINSEYQSGQITFSEREKQLSQLDRNNVGSQNVDRFFKDAGVSGLKTNISGGTKYTAGFDMRTPGSIFSPDTKSPEDAAGATGSKESINAAVDFINKTHEDFSTALTNSGISENRQDIIKDYIDKSLKGDAELIARYELDILSGNKSLAAVDMAVGLETSKDPKDIAILKGIKESGLDPLQVAEKATKFADTGMQDRVLEMASKGQNAEIDTLVTNYEKVQALPPEIVKSLKLNLETNVGDINRLGPITEGLTANFKLLDQLPAGIDKESFFKFNAVDANGNPIPLNDLAEKVKDFNNAYNNLDSGNKKLRKEAEIAIYRTVNDDPKAAENALAQARKDIEDFDKLPALVRSEVIMAYASTGQAQKALDIFLENAKKIGYMDQGIYQKLLADANAEKGKLETTIATAIAGGSVPIGSETKSALQSAKDAARQTKESIAAQSKLLAAGISLEALEGLSPEAIIELSKQSGKELRNNIKSFNEQAESIKNNALAFEMLRLSQNPIQQAIEDSKEAVEGYNDEINVLNKTLEEASRNDELDRRKIEDRNKVLENLAKKEKSINDQYDARITALDRVANANDRVAEKQRQQIDLASALTSGDIGGAARAAAAMTQTGAQNQIEDTKTALEAQRQAELDGLTESVNGQLLTRKQIEDEINAIEETMYQRTINLRDENDKIYQLQQNIKKEQEKQSELNKILAEEEKAAAEKAYEKLGIEEKISAQKKDQLKKAIALSFARYTELNPGFKIDLAKYKKQLGLEGFALGGKVGKYAYGGNVNYKGSREAPPVARMAMGSIVPGLGNTDRIPALLTPGEFVVRKSVAQANMPLLKALNSNVFPEFGQSLQPTSIAPINTTTFNAAPTLYNNYNVNVNVAGTDSSANDIANIVVRKIKTVNDRNVRGSRY
jgi:TP901 family phage tail tape measure protein